MFSSRHVCPQSFRRWCLAFSLTFAKIVLDSCLVYFLLLFCLPSLLIVSSLLFLTIVLFAPGACLACSHSCLDRPLLLSWLLSCLDCDLILSWLYSCLDCPLLFPYCLCSYLACRNFIFLFYHVYIYAVSRIGSGLIYWNQVDPTENCPRSGMVCCHVAVENTFGMPNPFSYVVKMLKMPAHTFTFREADQSHQGTSSWAMEITPSPSSVGRSE